RKEAAQQLGWPDGTVATRLARGRALLAKRLLRQGLILSSGALATNILERAAGSVPVSLLKSTAQAASCYAAGRTVPTEIVSARVAALAQGVLTSMFLMKLKVVAAGLMVVVLLAAGTGVMLTAAPGETKPIEQEQTVSPSQAQRQKVESVKAFEVLSAYRD